MQRFKPLNFLFYLSVFSLSLGQFSLLTKGGGTPIYLFDLIVGFYAFLGILLFLAGRKKTEIPANFFWFLGFSFFAAISLFLRLTTLPMGEFLISGFYLIRWLIYLISAIITYNLVKLGELKLDLFFRSLLISALFVSVAGFIQLVVLPDFTVLDASLGWDPHKNRLASTFFDPNFTGGYLSLIFGFFLSLHVFKIRKLKKAELLVFMPIIVVAIFLTFSRSAWGMLAVIVFFLGIMKARWLILVSVILAILTYFAVPRVQTRITGITDPSDSAAFRLVSWSNTLEIASDNLLTGVGFNAFKFAQMDYGFIAPGEAGGNSAAGSDSSLLLVLATTGIVGFILFLGGFLSVVKNSIYLPIILGLLLQSQFINALFYPQIMFIWLSIWGLASLFVFDKNR